MKYKQDYPICTSILTQEGKRMERLAVRGEIIHDAETIIGYSWDIADEVMEEMEDMDEMDQELFQELLDELEQHDGLVRCNYHPMGAYWVEDLIAKEAR